MCFTEDTRTLLRCEGLLKRSGRWHIGFIRLFNLCKTNEEQHIRVTEST